MLGGLELAGDGVAREDRVDGRHRREHRRGDGRLQRRGEPRQVLHLAARTCETLPRSLPEDPPKRQGRIRGDDVNSWTITTCGQLVEELDRRRRCGLQRNVER